MADVEPFRILIAIDGSEESLRALRHAVAKRQSDERVVLHLLNVQPALRADVTTFLPAQNVRDFHRERGEQALAAARRELDAAGVPYLHHVSVGDSGEVIAAFAVEIGASEIMMSTRGQGRAIAALLGSCATETLRHATVPVTFVK